MASRSTIRTSIRRFLAVDSDDPEYDDDVLNPIIQEAVNSLVTDINLQNPTFNSASVTLTADSSTGHVYTFATQSSPITDFAGWLELRWNDPEGLALHECRREELRSAGSDFFAIRGRDESAVIHTSRDSSAGTPIWMLYRVWPSLLTEDVDAPGGIPERFHDVIALEALFAFALGGEQRIPPHLYTRWVDRRAQLIHHVGKRGVGPSRSRIYTDPLE